MPISRRRVSDKEALCHRLGLDLRAGLDICPPIAACLRYAQADKEAFKLAGCPSIFLGTVSLPFDPPQGREGLERSNRRRDRRSSLLEIRAAYVAFCAVPPPVGGALAPVRISSRGH